MQIRACVWCGLSAVSQITRGLFHVKLPEHLQGELYVSLGFMCRAPHCSILTPPLGLMSLCSIPWRPTCGIPSGQFQRQPSPHPPCRLTINRLSALILLPGGKRHLLAGLKLNTPTPSQKPSLARSHYPSSSSRSQVPPCSLKGEALNRTCNTNQSISVAPHVCLQVMKCFLGEV